MKHFAQRLVLLNGVALATFVGLLTPAQAQDNTSEDEIIVTAQRREQNLQDTPLSVTALSAAVLENNNIRTAQDLMQLTPGLQVNAQAAGDAGGSATYFLRGMGQTTDQRGVEPAVGIYVDDFYFPSIQGSVFSIVDLERVEVLRGPQGTLFGRNTIGGAIRYTTEKPEGEFEAGLEGTLGSFGRQDITGVLNVPIGDVAAVRISAGQLHTDGYVDPANGGPDAGESDVDLVRVAGRIWPSDAITVDLAYQQTKTRQRGFPYYQPGPIVGTPGQATGIWNATYAPANSLPQYNNAWASQCFYCNAGTERREVSDADAESANATIRWDVTDNFSITSLTGHLGIDYHSIADLDGTPLRIFDPEGSREYDAFSQEFQFNGSLLNDRFYFVAGVFYYEEDFREFQNPGQISYRIGAVLPRSAERVRNTTSRAAYIDTTFDVTDRFGIVAGVRVSEDEKDLVARNAVTSAVIDQDSGSWQSTTWRAGVTYDWSDDIMTYFTVSTGFRGGGFNFVSNNFTEFDPETAANYEIGARTELFDRRLRFNPTVFYTEWQDIQVQSIVPLPTGSAISIDNAAAATGYGFELEAAYHVTDSFTLGANLATLDISYDDIGGALGITLGSPIQRAPELSYGVNAQYRTTIAGDYDVTMTANYSWVDDQASTGTDADNLTLPAYGLLGARMQLASPNDRWRIAIFASNLTDEEYFVGGVNFTPSGVGTARYTLGRPQEFGISLDTNF